MMRSHLRVSRGRPVAALACALVLAGAAGTGVSLLSAESAAAAPAATQGSAASATGVVTPVKLPATATTEACLTTGAQAERSATFVGEMSALPGTARMQMRVEILEHTAGELGFRPVTYPGIGGWLRSSPGVKTYKNLDKVTDLAAPATYRAEIHFRWLNAHGKAIKALELRTPRCVQTTEAGMETGAPSTPAANAASF